MKLSVFRIKLMEPSWHKPNSERIIKIGLLLTKKSTNINKKNDKK